jgi:ribosomal protein L32
VPTCPSCGEPTAPGRFCVRCGAPQDGHQGPSRHRTQFAAAPSQRRLAPWLVSTLFPHLPRHAERAFHLALGAGVVIVAGLAIGGLYPVALLSAALLMPVLTGLYFFDVDVGGGEPLWAWMLTFGWGAAVGAGAGLISRWAAPGSSALLDRASAFHAVVGGIALPAGALLASLAGPALLLRRPRFRTALDGATLCAAGASTCAALQAAVTGIGVLAGGVRPAGALAPWVERLLALGVATPVLMMSAGGGAGAALWLRYRAPVKDRRALGRLGSPAAAVALGCLLVAAGAVGETVLPAGGWLAWLVLLDLAAIVLLRRAIHIGLLEEAAERPIGPEIVCANCGQPTPQHAFCARCGVSQAALPRHHQGRLAAGGPFRAHRRLAVLVAGSLAVLAIGFPVVVIAAPAPRAPRCSLHVRCGRPPVLPVAPTLTPAAAPRYLSWRSAALGFRARYLSSQWQAGARSPTTLTLEAPDGLSQLTVSGSTTPPPAALAARASALGSKLLGVTADTTTADEILGPAVGERPGVSEVVNGTTVSPQGPQTPVRAELMSAGHGGLTITVTVLTSTTDASSRGQILLDADDVIDSIAWP